VELREVTGEGRQVWATDITYIPLQKGFQYLVAIMDLHSRHVLCWKLLNSLNTEFCLVALDIALSSGLRPQIFHFDQGGQFTSTDFVGRLHAEKIKISWSGRKLSYGIQVESFGAPSNTRRYTSMPTVMAWRLRSAWPASCGGTAM
jgi:putative transposase